MVLSFKAQGLFSLASATLISGVASASVALTPGAPAVALPGASVAVEADLAGTVVQDNIIPFRISNAAGALLFEGKLQNRLVRSARTGLLHFYYRVRDTTPGLNGIVKSVYTKSFETSSLILADWRPDGLGMVNPIQGQRSAGLGQMLKFNFNTSADVLVGGRDSRFFFVKTKVQNFNTTGQTTIQLTDGSSTTLSTLAPAL